MPKLDKKVERLRAVEYTTKQVDSLIPNLSAIGEFSGDDKSLMESFKKIYQLGVNQLRKFISDLDSKGKNVDEYTILYYTRQLALGPLRFIVSQLTQDKQYWKPSHDVIGYVGNLNKSQINTPILSVTETPMADSFVTHTKTPDFITNNINNLVVTTNNMFALAMNGSIQGDNTLPLVDKKPAERIAQEGKGGYNTQPHGNYMVCDADSYIRTQSISDSVASSVEQTLGKEDYRLYGFKKTYNPYKAEDNVNITKNVIINRVIEGDTVIETDLTGNTFENDAVRAYEIKVPGKEKDKILKLHTVAGQLGGTDEIKKMPL